jgi:hypothetical protein
MGTTNSTHGKMINAYKILVRKPEGKRPLGRLGINGGITFKWV